MKVAPSAHRIGGWVGPRAGGEEKNSQLLPGLEPPIIQDHSPALYTAASVQTVFIYLFVYLFVCLFICLFIHSFIHSFICTPQFG